MPEPGRVVTRTASSPSLLVHEFQSKLTFRLPSTSVMGASLMIFKAIVGAGLFALPFAFKLLGYAGATITMAFVGMLTFYTGMVVIRVHDVVVRDTLAKGTTYVSLARYCFGDWAARIVYGLVVFTTLGCNGAFLVFIGSVLHSVWPAVPLVAFSGLTALAVLPLVLLRSTRFLTYASIVGNVGVGLVVLAVLVRGAEVGDVRPLPAYVAFAPQNFMRAFGIVGFLYACATTLVTIEKSMTDRRRFGAAYLQTITFVFVSCSAFGLVNYLYYGTDVCSIVIINLGDGPLALLAKLAIVVDLAFSYPISMAAAREIVEKSLLSEHTHALEAKRTVIRVAMVLCAFILALFPNFGLIVNVVGGVSVSGLSFILPPLMLLQLRRYHLAAHERQVAYMRAAGLLQNDAKGPLHAAATPSLGFLDHIFNVHPLSPDATPEDGTDFAGSSQTCTTESASGHAHAASLRQSLWQHTHPFGARSSEAALQDSFAGDYAIKHAQADTLSKINHPAHSFDLRALLGAVAIGPMAFNPRFATLHAADHVRAVPSVGEEEGRAAQADSEGRLSSIRGVAFSQPPHIDHKRDDGPQLLLHEEEGPALHETADTADKRAAPSLAHVLRESEEEAMRALLLALQHVHWPRLPAWFPLHPPAPAILPVQGPLPATVRAAPPSATPQQLSAQGTGPLAESAGRILLHGHRVPAQLASLHSSYDVLSATAAHDANEPLPVELSELSHRGPTVKMRKGRRASIITHVAQRRRHMVALQLLGVGSRAETAFLFAVVAFGVAVLLMTTTQSILQATGAAGPDDQAAVCKA